MPQEGCRGESDRGADLGAGRVPRGVAEGSPIGKPILGPIGGPRDRYFTYTLYIIHSL